MKNETEIVERVQYPTLWGRNICLLFTYILYVQQSGGGKVQLNNITIRKWTAYAFCTNIGASNTDSFVDAVGCKFEKVEGSSF